MLLGITERLEYVDAPSHVEDLKRYRARGYAMTGNRITVSTDRPEDLVEVHPPSRGKVDMGGLTGRAVSAGAGTNAATDLYWGLGSSVWNNTGDTATLKRPDGSEISSSTRP